MSDASARLRDLPQVNDVLRRPELAALPQPRWAIVEAVRRVVADRRRAILEGRGDSVEVTAADVTREAALLVRPSLRRVINATGVVLHTNLGRAPLADEAVRRVAEVAAGYCNLEYDVGGRTRGSRHDHLATLLADLSGAPASLVVNNNAAAVLVALAALAGGRQVIVSRGELVEIGGSFRIPDVLVASGAKLVEVGTTNKTRLADYEAAIGPETALVLKVHRSNFAVVGFTEEVIAAELVALGRRRNLPVVIDLGSGTLEDPATFADAGLAAEPTVRAAVASGADLVTFSGDKLLGGPQAGILLGTEAAIAQVRKHPLVRAVRPDKMTLAALEATLELHRAGRARERVPALRMLAATPPELRARAEALCAAIGHAASLRTEVVEVASAVGGGALPTSEPPSFAVALSATDGRSADDLDLALRHGEPPIVARIADGRVLLDVRTLLPGEEGEVAAAISASGRL